MKKMGLALFFLTAIFSCSKEKYFDGPDFYQDDFESYNQPEDLLLDDDVLWSYTQLTMPANNIVVDSTFAHNGTRSLKFNATKSNSETVSKASIAKQKMAFWENETVRLTAWYYLQGNDDLEWLFLMDLEEQATIGAGPGMRIAMVNNQLRIEHKFLENDIVQDASTAIDFPRNQWVEIRCEVKLSRKHKGTVKLWQDGQLIIDAKERVTLPKDILYFQLGTKGMYSSCEIGITANSKDNDLVLWVDDVKFEKVD
jgi:hypothetical protein